MAPGIAHSALWRSHATILSGATTAIQQPQSDYCTLPTAPSHHHYLPRSCAPPPSFSKTIGPFIWSELGFQAIADRYAASGDHLQIVRASCGALTLQCTPHCTLTVPSLYHRCTEDSESGTYRRLDLKQSWEEQSLYHHCNITAPSLYYDCTITVPSCLCPHPSLYHHCTRLRRSQMVR